MARVLLLEIIPVDRLQRPISFPFLQGALKAAGTPVRRMRFAVPAAARALSGTSGFVLGGEEEASLRRVLSEFAPTHVIVGPEPSSSVLRVVESNEPRPAVMPFALQIAEGQIPLVPLGLRPTLQGIEGFEHFLGLSLRTPGQEKLNIYEIATPDFEWEPGNKAAEEAWSLPYLVTGEACAYHKGLTRNPVFQGVDTSNAARLDGCTFCVRPAVEDEWHHEPAELMGQQLEALARTHRKQSGRLAVRILGDAFLLNVESFAKTVKTLALPPCDFLLDGRADVLVAQRPSLENALHELEGLPHTLNISLVGVENFDPDELVRMNKGAGWKVNLDLIRLLLELENRHRGFVVRRHSPLSLILFTPWTRLQDLALNVAILREGRIESLFNKVFTSRMRLYRTLPIHALAERDGLLTDRYSDALFDTARENFYSDEIPWRFADPRVESVNSIFLRLTDRTDRPRDELGLAIDALGLSDRLALAAAVIDAAQLSSSPLSPLALLEQAKSLLSPESNALVPNDFANAIRFADGSALEILPGETQGNRLSFKAGRSVGTHPLLAHVASGDTLVTEAPHLLIKKDDQLRLALGARAQLFLAGQPTQPELWDRLSAIRRASDAAAPRPVPHVSRESRPRVGPDALALAERFTAAIPAVPGWMLGDYRLDAVVADRDDEVIFRFSAATGPLELHVSPLRPGRGAYLKAGPFAIAHAKETPIDSKAKDDVARRLGAALEPLSAGPG